MKLEGKKILLGITGSIAAYKTPELVRQLVKKKALVKVVMTTSSADFVSPLVLSTVSKNKVFRDLVEDDSWQGHVELGLWADVIIIAPASANTMAKMAHGICDNMLLATYLSARCPVFIAPAMDVDMYQHPSTQKNIETLKSFDTQFIGPATGELASGLTGSGRMEEPEMIVSVLETFFNSDSVLKNKHIVITAGPTREAIDPVRFISNHSTGKMGYAIANEAKKRGADVTLILGKGAEKITVSGIRKIKVDAAEEMFNESVKNFTDADVFIMAAAVADYKPLEVSKTKIKKRNEDISIPLTRTVDIASELGKKKKKQLLVGFALETNNEMDNAKKKLVEKNLDLIVLNSLNDAGAGFGTDTNKITLLDKNNITEQFALKSKSDVAKDILDKIEKLINENKQ